MSISIADIRGLYTTRLIDVYRERPKPTMFLQSFFPVVTTPTKTVYIEVERMGEKIAIDVVRGTEGNRNQFTRSTQKMTEPPFFREYFDFTELDLYDRVLGSTMDDNGAIELFNQLALDGAERLDTLVDKFRRAKEVQCAQVLLTGVVTSQFEGSFNFLRKPSSIVDLGAGNYFLNAIDPFPAFVAAGDFIRKVGRSADGTFNAIMGSQALADLLNNAKFQARQNLFNMALDQVIAPSGVRDAMGNTFHGTITAGAYKIQLWAYPQFYDLQTGTNANPVYTSTPYIDPKQVIVIPSMPRFKMAHAAVPRLIGAPGQMPVQGEYVFMEFLDERKAKHDMDCQTAFIAIPSAVDTIYTFKAVA